MNHESEFNKLLGDLEFAKYKLMEAIEGMDNLSLLAESRIWDAIGDIETAKAIIAASGAMRIRSAQDAAAGSR
jgi:hypothetical protein